MTAVSIVRWILFSATSFFGAVFVVANWHGLLAWLIKRRRSSGVPVLGGALLALAMLLNPAQSTRPLWWLPLVLDPGCLLLLVDTVLFRLRGGHGPSSQPPPSAGLDGPRGTAEYLDP